MKKLLVVCGPTATGKTKLALYLAKKFSGEIVSADSRQVYKKMNIGTGKDLPANTKLEIKKLGPTSTPRLVGYYSVDRTCIWGYDIASPKKEFSVSHYTKYAREIIRDIYKRNKLPILVGGTGLYIKAVVDGIETANVLKNQGLRNVLEKLSVAELFEKLSQMDSIKAASLNSSDRKNPRRLIRAIEVAQSKIINHEKIGKPSAARIIDEDTKIYFIGIKTDWEALKKRIVKRVEKRISDGIEDEIRKLFSAGVTWEMQSMTSLGYRQFREHFEGKISKEEVIKKWQSEEIKYAKRQLTWFNKEKRIKWFEVNNEKDTKSVEKEVKRWYDEKDDKKS